MIGNILFTLFVIRGADGFIKNEPFSSGFVWDPSVNLNVTARLPVGSTAGENYMGF